MHKVLAFPMYTIRFLILLLGKKILYRKQEWLPFEMIVGLSQTDKQQFSGLVPSLQWA